MSRFGLLVLVATAACNRAPTEDADLDATTGNAGVLIFSDGLAQSEYVPWADVERVELDGRP